MKRWNTNGRVGVWVISLLYKFNFDFLLSKIIQCLKVLLKKMDAVAE